MSLKKKTISPVDVFGKQHGFESSEQIEEIPLVSKISKSVGNWTIIQELRLRELGANSVIVNCK